MRKPEWLDKKVNISVCRKMNGLMKSLRLRTVCQEALCPNISECFSNKTATFIILGNVCTRGCSFCGVTKGGPLPVDFDEPRRIKEAVEKLNLNYVVITSPTRDDLEDGGVGIFCRTVKEIKNAGANFRSRPAESARPFPKVEILIPDFLGKENLIKQAACCGARVVAHNLETVPSLYKKVRKGSGYGRSLKVLRIIKKANKKIFTKSGLMLGMGEKKEEVTRVLIDLRKVECDFLTLGQYLPPSLKSYPVKEYIAPEKFLFLKEQALKLGFKSVKSSPYTRSSYRAHFFLR